jgi:hypothetical protein
MRCNNRARHVAESTSVGRRLRILFTFASPIRRKSPALFLFLLLGFAVFAWGSHYKLSLYRSSGARRTVPAKLLSQKERLAACASGSSYGVADSFTAAPRGKLTTGAPSADLIAQTVGNSNCRAILCTLSPFDCPLSSWSIAARSPRGPPISA